MKLNHFAALLLLLLGSSLSAQDALTFEDEQIVPPGAARTKGAMTGRPATLSALGIAIGPNKTSVPVLLPNDERLLRNAQFIADSVSYTAVYTTLGATISIFGTRRVAVRSSQGGSGAQESSAKQISIDRTEFGYSASFKEFGANYLVTVECSQLKDPKCSKPTFIYSVANGLSAYLQE